MEPLNTAPTRLMPFADDASVRHGTWGCCFAATSFFPPAIPAPSSEWTGLRSAPASIRPRPNPKTGTHPPRRGWAAKSASSTPRSSPGNCSRTPPAGSCPAPVASSGSPARCPRCWITFRLVNPPPFPLNVPVPVPVKVPFRLPVPLNVPLNVPENVPVPLLKVTWPLKTSDPFNNGTFVESWVSVMPPLKARSSPMSSMSSNQRLHRVRRRGYRLGGA